MLNLVLVVPGRSCQDVFRSAGGSVGVLTRDRDFSGCSGRGFGSPNN